MDRVTVNIETQSGMRASEIIADLRTAAETLYFPMKLVGFRDHRQDMHLCPHQERRQACPHELDRSDPDYVDYELTLERERQANLRLDFPHARVTLYLS
jgi:hypothetical protein